MGDTHHMNPAWQRRLAIFYRIFPTLTDKLWNIVYKRNYANWMNNLYEEENLGKYNKLLDSLHNRILADHVTHFYVLTPSCLPGGCYSKYDSIRPHLQKLGFDVLEVNKACKMQLADCTDDELKANPVNYHPGTYLTDVFSSEVFNYIQQEHLVPDSLQRPLVPGP
jgi:hypothetical protein